MLKKQKDYAKMAVEFIVPHITDKQELLELGEIINAKDQTMLIDPDTGKRVANPLNYIRQERGRFRFHLYNNTETWRDIVGVIKTQIQESPETAYLTSTEYPLFYNMMNTHRNRTIAPCRKTGSARLFAQHHKKPKPMAQQSAKPAQTNPVETDTLPRRTHILK